MSEINDWDKTAANNNSAPPNGWPENMNYSEVNNTAREGMSAHARLYADMNGTLVTAGAANAYILTPNRTVTAYAGGLGFIFKANHTNTGAATIDVSGLGAKDLKNMDGSALSADHIEVDRYYFAFYQGTYFVLSPLFSNVLGNVEMKGLVVDAGTSGTITFGDISTAYGRLYADTTGTFIGSVTADPLILHTTSTERMRIDSSGNVGIGTSSPAYALDLTGAMRIAGSRSTYIDASEDSSAAAHIFTTDALEGDFSQLAGNLVLQARVTDTVYRDIIFAGGLSTASDLMRITGEGNVGIGTSSPDEALDVSGNIAVSGTVDGRDVSADGAMLDSVASNAWTSSNDGPGTGMNSDLVDGLEANDILTLRQNTQNSNYTLLIGDIGKSLYHSNGTAYSWTVPPNSSVAFPVGTAITMINDASGAVNITITRGSGVALILGGDGTDQNCTLARYGVATIIKVGTDKWYCSGNGVS
ncbi:hypothetical protein N9J84_05300 [Porticoccaceae bacterium]|nr:hypothetical protein [Porticoccaceae bacterium]